jgi:integrase
LRTSEIERLRWADVDMASRVIKLDGGRTKTGLRRLAPICDSLAAWLNPIVRTDGPVWGGTHNTLYNGQRALARKAGIKWKANAGRHAFASYRLAATGDLNRTALELGHAPAVLHAHYKELCTEAGAKAYFSIMPATAPKLVQLTQTATA